MKKVKEQLKANGASDDTVKEFETGASSYAKKVVANFKDYEFLIGESMDPDGMYVALLPSLETTSRLLRRSALTCDIGSSSSTTARMVSLPT